MDKFTSSVILIPWPCFSTCMRSWLTVCDRVTKRRSSWACIDNPKLEQETIARGPAVTQGSFLAGAHRELSVALIKCQGSVYRGCANLLARAAGRPVLTGVEVPYVD